MSRRNPYIRVQIYESEYRAIVAEARRLPQTETGGDLYGTFTHGSNPIICLASGPGPKVRHEHTHFEQDTAFTTYWEGRLTRDFGLQYIGSWHSHHFLGLHEPSDGDVGAAQVYAQQHNRQTTLEIIVNHRLTGTSHGEQEFTTTLRPYFYPNAQRARTERFVLADFVPLSGISPFRQQLGRDFSASFNLINWQKAAGFQFPAAQVSQNSAPPTASDDSAVIIPEMLGVELQSIMNDIQDFDIQQKGEVFLIKITLNNAAILALVVQKPPEMRITRVNLVDPSWDINENISSKLHDERRIHFSLNQRNVGVFRKLLQEARLIRQEMVRVTEEKRRREAVEEETRKAKQRQDEQDALERSRALAQSLDEQRRAAQYDLDNLRNESQIQLGKQELEIKQLTAQLDAAKQQLATQQTSAQRSEEQQLDVLRRNVEALENQLMEAQKELGKQRQLEIQLNEAQKQIEAQKHDAEELGRRLVDIQVKLAAHEQLEAQLNTAKQQLEAQQHEVSELQTELNNTRNQLQVLKEQAKRGKNRDGPIDPADKEKDPLLTIIIAIVLLIIIVVALVFILSRTRILAL